MQENGLIDVPAQHSQNFGNDASLRAELSDAIDRRNKADEHAATAKDTARRAERACADARLSVSDFRAKHDAKLTELREAHVRAISDAIRQDKPVPGAPTPAPLDIAALQALEGQHAALEVSSTYLGLEANEAAAEAAKLAQEVHTCAVAVADHVYAVKHAELKAALSIVRKLEEEASAFHILDECRPGGALFATMKAELAIHLDREKALIAEDPQLRERRKMQEHIEGLEHPGRTPMAGFSSPPVR